MAMEAKQAAEKIKNGNFDDVDALYEALNGKKEYGSEFSKLLQHIETKVKMDISLYTGLATAAKSVEDISANINPLDEKDPHFADARAKLAKIELSYVVEEKGKPVVKVATGKERDKMIAQLVAAAKLETKDELRGASSPESPTAKRFLRAASDTERKDIYQAALNDKIDLAVLQSVLITETAKINADMQKKYSGDPKKANEEAKILLSAREKEIKQKIIDLGNGTLNKISVSVDGAIGYCANVAVKTEEHLAEYKNNIKKIATRINQGFAKLKDQGKDLRNQWQKARTGANKVFETCNQKMSDGIVAFNEGCKHVWENKYEIARAAIKAINKNKYEIGADMVAAAGFAATVATGGTAALVGGAAYAAYTIGRRVVYEAYKQKKEDPNKSYKQIYTNGKFLTKAAFACGAAALSWGIADTAASAGANIATEAAAEVAKKLAAERMLKRGMTMIGSVTSNVVGVAIAKDEAERKKEWKSLGVSVIAAGVTLLVVESCSGHGNDVNTTDHESNTGVDTDTDTQTETGVEEKPGTETGVEEKPGTETEVEEKPGTETGVEEKPGTETEVEEKPGTETGAQEQETQEENSEHPENNTPEMQDFPDQWNENMGISKRQFETLKGWYDKLDTTDGAGMDRFYSHAAHYATELSVNSNNPMTAEQVLFKFSRLAAITSVKSGEYGTIGTGSLGKQLDEIYHLLGCGDKLDASQMEAARKTLDICTLNESGRADGRMDATKFFAVAGAGYRGLPVDEDGTLSMTRRIRVIGEGTNCPGDKRVMYEEVRGGESKIEIKSDPVVTPTPATRVVTEEVSGSDTTLQLEGDAATGGDEVVIGQPDQEEQSSVIIGATSQMGDRPGIEGARAAQNLTEGSKETQIGGRKKKLGAEMLRELQEKGLVK